jgi:pimeloyl-ACP methyl ester carboxylesterase
VFDIEGIVAMYQSYEATDLWPMLETQPVGLSVDFVRAERSAFVWADEDVGRIGTYGGRVHYLANSSHWVHIDNPDGLLEILAPSFERKK